MSDLYAEEVHELRRVLDAASPEPWCYYGEDLWRGVTAEQLAALDADPDLPYPGGDLPWPENLLHVFHGDPVRIEDAEFIATARTMLPHLLAEVERRRADWDRLIDLCNRYDAKAATLAPPLDSPEDADPDAEATITADTMRSVVGHFRAILTPEVADV